MVHPNRSSRKVLVAASVAQRAHCSAIARYARENDWHLVSDMMATGTFPHGWCGDGILALTGHQPELLAQIRASGLPCVVIAPADHPGDLRSVVEDRAQIGRMAADHFLDRAHRSFAWAPLVDDRANREQLRGFRARLAEYGCDCHVFPPAHQRRGLSWHCDWVRYRRQLYAELAALPRPTAVFAYNDCVAANVIDVCREHGIAIPEDIAILGAGNDPLVGESVPISLSTVETDHEQMALQAAELLDQLMNGQAAPAQVLVPPKGVIPRLSTDVTAVAEPRIARALAYIAEHYSNPMLSVLDVATAVGVSRRNLERNFRLTTGCTVREHIVRTRMQEASRLLTHHPRTRVAEIAELTGFAGVGSFFRTFRQFYGVSPHAHRQDSRRDAAHRPVDVEFQTALLPAETAAAG